MNFGALIPIVAIIASACIFIAILHYRHEGRKGRDESPLERENEQLKRTIGRLEERLAVLERIATDPAERTAREIERLRD
jgi:hypothetical protein